MQPSLLRSNSSIRYQRSVSLGPPPVAEIPRGDKSTARSINIETIGFMLFSLSLSHGLGCFSFIRNKDILELKLSFPNFLVKFTKSTVMLNLS